MSIRYKYLEAFRPDEKYAFSFCLPFQYTNGIDSMAWVGCVTALARLAGDSVVEAYGREHLSNLIMMGKHTRNYGNGQQFNWEPSLFSGYTRKVKPQAFAGPSMYMWCVYSGVTLPAPWFKSPVGTAEALCAVAPVFGYAIRWLPFLRQHINSVVFAHLMLRKKLPSSMHFLCKDNPVYAYAAGMRFHWYHYPNTGDWPAKNYPGKKYKEKPFECTPSCTLAGMYAAELSMRF